MKHLLIGAVMMMAGCASPGEHGSLHRGAARPVRSPVFNPAQDASHTVGQPGHVRPGDVPRSPHARVLPQTPESRKEAGVWSASSPVASNETDGGFKFFDVPIAPPAEDMVPERSYAAKCMVKIHQFTKDLLDRNPAVSKADHFKQCVLTSMVAACLGADAENVERRQGKGEIHSNMEAARQKLAADADRKCLAYSENALLRDAIEATWRFIRREVRP